MHPPNTNSFEPKLSGTSEQLWAQHLFRRSDWAPAEGPLLVVAPHPDDEIMGAGGLIHTWAGMGRSVTVLSVTDGEAALPARENLDRVRRGGGQTAVARPWCTPPPPLRR